MITLAGTFYLWVLQRAKRELGYEVLSANVLIPGPPEATPDIKIIVRNQLIDPKTPTVFLVPQDSMYEKTMANLAMIRARNGPIIALATEGDTQIKFETDDVIDLPKTLDVVYPILATVPLQLLAYHIAVARGCDVDKPRNLAKSVTVE